MIAQKMINSRRFVYSGFKLLSQTNRIPASAVIYNKLPNVAAIEGLPIGNNNTLRNFSSQQSPPERTGSVKEAESRRSLPRLMNFPEILWPSTFKTIKNWILAQFIIRPYFDSEFNIREFVHGAKRALQVVSSKLVMGDFASLDKLVAPEAIGELTPTIQKLSVSQRRQLEIREEDIYFSFPYQIGIIFDETNEKAQKRWVEITMVFHVLRGLTEMRQRGEDIPWNMGSIPEYQEKVFVCNYRFIKEFTTGNQSDWTINVLNHFKPIDLINEK